jgi:multidrug efflux system membrane fusion protein
MKNRCQFILIAAAAAAGCAAPSAVERPVARAVRVVEARPAEAPRGLRYAATVHPIDEVALALKAQGYVTSLHQRRGIDGTLRVLQPGDVVRAGTELVRLRDAEYRERLHQAEGALQEVEASLEQAGLDLDRARQLFAAESLTKPDLDAAQGAYDMARARLASARAQVESARLALDDCVLVAPADGVVLERRLETGMLAGPGTVAFVMARVRVVKALFGVPDSGVASVALGQQLVMTTEAFPGASFEGFVSSVAPSADPQGRVFAVEVTLDNQDGRLRPGMIGAIEVDVRSDAASRSAGVAVPLSAIVRSPHDVAGVSVFVADAAGDLVVARARTVTLGPAVGNAVSITSGLQAGERVIAMGATLVSDGEPVRIIP